MKNITWGTIVCFIMLLFTIRFIFFTEGFLRLLSLAGFIFCMFSTVICYSLDRGIAKSIARIDNLNLEFERMNDKYKIMEEEE